MTDLSKRAKEIIGDIAYVTIATVDDKGQPWNSPVFSAYDKDYNLYWGSYQQSQHSKNLRSSGRVFLVIYDSTVAAGEGEGVYIKATGTELTDPAEIKSAHQLLWNRHNVSYWKLEQVQGEAPIRLYKAIPEKVWLNGDDEIGGNYIDTLVEVDLRVDNGK